MMPKINKNLIILKIFLFFMYGAVGSLWPFLTLHMNQLGLNVEEIAVINLILPFTAAFCKPIVGIIADKTGRLKLMLFIMFITTSCFFTSLLLVPPVDKSLSPVKDVEFPSSFTCNQTSARVSTRDTCWNQTSIFNFNWTIIKLQNCSFHHCTTDTPQILKPLPKLCFNTTTTTATTSIFQTRCLSLTHSDKISLKIPVVNFDVTESKCEFQIGQNRIRGTLATDLRCPSPKDGCEVKCESALAAHAPPSESAKAKGSSLTFWLYLALRCCAEMILSSCYPLSDVINLNLTGRFGGYFGQQQLVGILALGIFSPLSGFVVDYIARTTGVTSYAPCFFISNALMLVSVVALYVMPAIETKDFKSKSASGSLCKGMRRMLSNESLLVLFFISAALGLMWGYMETFLYLYLLQKKGPRLLIGLTQLVSVLPALPILYKSALVMRKIGHVNLIIVAFFTYTIRCTGYVFTVNPWWALLLESTRVLSVYLPRLCFIMYAQKLTPPELKVTTQSIVFLLHFDVGRGLGSLFGGILKDALGDRTTFQIIAVYSGLIGCAYFALHHFYLKNKLLQNRKTSSLSLSVYEKDKKSKPIQNGNANRSLLQPD